jgi:transcriptional regulator with XRE-family HTH domain
VQRGAPGSGISVDPARVREARLEAGLSLRQVAGDEVSATFIHFVEQGVSRPSRAVLALIARRTHKPISYFKTRPSGGAQPAPDLVSELTRVANQARQFARSGKLSAVEVQAMKLIELTVRQAAALTKSFERSRTK